jgi:hypothetical protein
MLPMARITAVLLTLLCLAAPAVAHDPSAWGGLFRSRDDGGSWLPVDADLFIGAALAVAVSPTDPNHLLYATDSRLMRSRNGGRDWNHEAADRVFGPTLAVAFGTTGKTMLASGGSGLFRSQGDARWDAVDAPRGVAPARAIVATGDSQFVLAGPGGLFRSTDDGRTWTRASGAPPEAPATALVVVSAKSSAHLVAVVGGNAWESRDAGATWTPVVSGLPAGRVEAVVPDPAGAGLWAFAADRVHTTIDGAWQPRGAPLQPAGTSVRGLAVADSGKSLVLATHRGLLRSTDGGVTWAQVQGALPTHLESGILQRDPHDTRTLYTGFALNPYPELWRRAEESAARLNRIDPWNIAGGAAVVGLLLIGGVSGVRYLRRKRG